MEIVVQKVYKKAGKDVHDFKDILTNMRTMFLI